VMGLGWALALAGRLHRDISNHRHRRDRADVLSRFYYTLSTPAAEIPDIAAVESIDAGH
jgi:hypothetical protein